jgi:hypothetical protein
MKNIRELTSVQIRIFPADYILYNYLLRKDFVDFILDKYKFTSHEMPFGNAPGDTPKVLVFKSGECKIEKKKLIIKRLAFENRRIVTDTLSTSKEATKLFNIIAKDIDKFQTDGNFKSSDVSFLSEEASCIVSLDFDYKDMFSEKFITFLNEDLKSRMRHDVFEVYPKLIRFEISFKPDEKLRKNRITLSPKQLIIEPRTEHPLDERVFFTSSPCDTDTHLNILGTLEKTFKG